MKEARVVVDKKFIIGKIDKRIYGSFIEHIGRAVYGGIYDPGQRAFGRKRFPQGRSQPCKGSGRAHRALPGRQLRIGLQLGRQRRTKRLEAQGARSRLVRNRKQPVRAGRVRRLGTSRRDSEVMMAVNLGSRGVNAAKNLLEYCNFKSGTYWSDQRSAERPRGSSRHKDLVPGQRDGRSLADRRKDGPGIRSTRLRNGQGHEMARSDHRACPVRKFQFRHAKLPEMGIHRPRGHLRSHRLHFHAPVFWKPGKRHENFLAKTLDMEDFIRTVIATCDYVKGMKRSRKTINLSFDEWNVWYHALPENARLIPWQEAPKFNEDIYNFADAVFVGLALITLLRHADRIKMACLAQLVNVIAPILTTPRGVIKQTIFYPFLHASRYGRGTVLGSLIDSPKYDSKDFTGVSLLDTVAVFDDEKATLTIFAVNRDGNEDIETIFTLGGFSGYSLVEHIVLISDDLAAVNDESHPEIVVPSRGTGGKLDGEKLAIGFPKLSWNVVRLAARK